MTEKQFKSKEELIKWIKKNRKYEYYPYSNTGYDYVKKLKQRKEVNCSGR